MGAPAGVGGAVSAPEGGGGDAPTVEDVAEGEEEEEEEEEGKEEGKEEEEEAGKEEGGEDGDGVGAGLAPSFLGRAMVLGVGKRIQDRKHRIWLPSVHDPWSFRTPQDEAPTGGTTHALALPAPKGWTSPAETQPTVNQDENCGIM